MVSVTGLHDGSSPWRLHVVSPDATTDAILRTAVDPPRWPDGPMARFKLARGVAALRVAEQHGLAAPRLIACDLDGHEAGLPASLETVLPANSGWPKTPTAAGWRDAGAAIARVHRVPLQPQEHLPLRSGDVRSRARVSASSPLLQLADELVRRHEPPRGEPVFLHGDVWPGNLLWIGDRCVGLIDWKEACVATPDRISPICAISRPCTTVQTGRCWYYKAGRTRSVAKQPTSPTGTLSGRSTPGTQWTY